MDTKRASRWILALVALGVAARVYRFALNSPLWWNEAFLAANFLKRDFAGLLRPLDYNQVCPPLFLWAELAMVRVVGFHEAALRVLPLLSGCLALVLFAGLARRVLDARAAAIAVALLAVAHHPIRLCAEVKPYGGDLLAAVLLLRSAWWVLEFPRPARAWLGLALASMTLIWLSYPAVLVVGAALVAVVAGTWKRIRIREKILASICASLTIASFLVLRSVCAAGQAAATAAEGMSEYWSDGFPDGLGIRNILEWLWHALLSEGLSFPAGNGGFVSAITCALMVVGAFALRRAGKGLVVLLLCVPIAISAGAAISRLYPFGVHARLSQHLVPSFALLCGAALDWLWSMIASRLGVTVVPRRARIAFATFFVLALVIPLGADTLRPYRTPRENAAREFARRFWPAVSEGAAVECLRWDESAAPWISVNPDVALYLCNQAIQRPVVAPVEAQARRFVLYWSPRVEPLDLADWLRAHPEVESAWVATPPDMGPRGARIAVFATRGDGLETLRGLQLGDSVYHASSRDDILTSISNGGANAAAVARKSVRR